MIKIILTTIFTCLHFVVFSQKVNLQDVWPAKWIMPNEAPAKEYAVHHFRKTFELDIKPDSLVVHTSGDNRYQLFVNGNLATLGPLRGDLRHWFYESTDIAPYLKEGKNIISSVVLNYGSHPPDAQLTVQTGFLLAADNKKFDFLNTDSSWKAIHNPAYTPSRVDKSQVNGYYGGGSKEKIDGRKYIWDWQKVEFDDSNWANAFEIETAFAKSCKWASRWKLTPRHLPQETRTSEKFQAIRLLENITIPDGFLSNKDSIIIPKNTQCRFVLDRGFETTAYPVFKVSKGKDAKVKFTYVEAPYIGDPKMKNKGDRNEIEGKTFVGVNDQFILDGGVDRIYSPLWWRAYRYLDVSIETEEEPLIITNLSAISSTYPFKKKSSFSVNNGSEKDSSLVAKIIEIGDRTMLACSHEHFMDCPYYEESQFEGDARVAMLVSYYNYGDPSLGKNAIEQFSWSVNDEGFLSARYPTNSLYYIPNFSIYWIGMLHDYLMIYNEPEYIKSKLPIMRLLLQYFMDHERADGTLKKLDYHQFVDWSFAAGQAPIDEKGYSAVVDLHYLLALKWAVALEKELGSEYFTKIYSQKIKKLSASLKEIYWNESKGLFSDVPTSDTLFSQHTNCLAILTDVIKGEEAKEVMKKVLAKQDMIVATLYWQFYVFEALEKSGLGDEYLNELDAWKEVMKLNVSTWPESGAKSRSECHAWGSSPNYHFLKIVAGISPLKSKFREIKIEPNFGDKTSISASFPHYMGIVDIEIIKNGNLVSGKIILPKSLKGIFKWEGKMIKLVEGENLIKL